MCEESQTSPEHCDLAEHRTPPSAPARRELQPGKQGLGGWNRCFPGRHQDNSQHKRNLLSHTSLLLARAGSTHGEWGTSRESLPFWGCFRFTYKGTKEMRARGCPGWTRGSDRCQGRSRTRNRGKRRLHPSGTTQQLPGPQHSPSVSNVTAVLTLPCPFSGGHCSASQ